MTFLSYAQNFEDVMLWRALRTVERGFYIDIGAADPDTDSVTRAFYDRGWSGINIEPVPSAARRLRAARLRDVTLEVAVGAVPGTAELFVVEGTGLSTLEPGALDAVERAGHRTQALDVELTTLADVCREYVPGEVHFLKIDVEGSEHAVLQGADFTRTRPWILLVEATAPMSTAAVHGAWEPIVLSAHYRFAYFDGLNRFYVAEEHFDTLAPSLRTPPNVFDDFWRVADGEAARRIAEAQAQVAALTVQAREAARASELASARGVENARLQEALLALQGMHEAALQAAQAAREETRDISDWVDAMRASTSWRATAPLRTATSLLGAVRGRLARPPQPAIAPVAPSPPEPPIPPPPSPPPVPAPPRAASGQLLHVVHQFHSGSAVGDAITNAMLLTRRLLREQGYRSEIFVEHLDPLLANELRPLDEMPLHGEYVLIVRHSMGFEAFDRVAALPAPKILIYHNITPPDLLAEMPALRHYAQLGREQLARWRPLVRGALGDSEYNAVELRRLGYDGAQACMLLFDVAALRARAAVKSAACRTGAFTILSVGRITPSKGQDDLVAAYAKFRREFDVPSRLVLVGRHDGAGQAYLATLRDRMAAEGLEAHVTLTGLVADDELHDWYSAADLYVSLSRHEGFGVPLVEAMAYDVPVLALPAGAVPYTLAGHGELLPDPGPATVATAMAGLARDPSRRTMLAERQRRSLDRFTLDRQVPALLQALAQAGVAALPDAGSRAMLGANMRFTVTGHINKSYSLAAINRAMALAVEAVRPGFVRVLPVEGRPSSDLSEVPPAMRSDIARLVGRAKPGTGPEMLISQHYPVLVPDDPGDVCVALFYWEESRVPAETIELLNRSFRGVLAPSRAVAKALVDSGLSVPVRVVAPPPDLGAFARLADRPSGRTPFTFLHVSSGFPRKGVDVLLAAFARAFRAIDPVRLVLKLFPNPHNDAAEQIARIRMRDPEIGEIELVDRDVTDAELLDIYSRADAVVLPSRGEGFNLPAAEAMAAGRPLIVTGFGGHVDFCTDRNARLVDYRFAPSASHLATPHSLWAEPDEADLASALRDAVADPAAGAARAAVARRTAEALRDQPGFVRRLSEVGLDFLLAPPRGRVRIGWFSTWQVRCGIAGYSQNLLATMPEDTDITVFCDTRTSTDQQAGPTIRPAWRLGDADSLPGLVSAIAAADPDVLVVQHQPALLSWATLARLLMSPRMRERMVAVTLHNTRHLLDIPTGEREAALSALTTAARVVVHTLADVNRLKDLQLTSNVTLLPHGAPPRRPAPPARPLVQPGAVVVGCYGFFLPGKGIDALIEAAAILRRDWPLIRLRLVNAEYGTPESAEHVTLCRALADRLGVPVEWHTDFLPTERSLDLLSGCDVVALPYQASKEASSAALRTALCAGGVVATTGLELFDEADDAVFRFSGCAPDDLAGGLDRLLQSTDLRLRIQEAAAGWLAERAWDDVGRRLLGMLTGLVRSA